MKPTAEQCESLCREIAPVLDWVHEIMIKHGIASTHGYVSIALGLNGYASMTIYDDKNKIDLLSVRGGDYSVNFGNYPNVKELCTIPRHIKIAPQPDKQTGLEAKKFVL